MKNFGYQSKKVSKNIRKSINNFVTNFKGNTFAKLDFLHIQILKPREEKKLLALEKEYRVALYQSNYKKKAKYHIKFLII